MALEGRKNFTREYAKRIALGTAITVGGITAIDAGIKKNMEKINTHLLTPAATEHVKNVTGASDSDITTLEPMLKELLIQEIKRSMESKRR